MAMHHHIHAFEVNQFRINGIANSLLIKRCTFYIRRSARFNGFVFSLVCPGHMNPWDMMEVTRHSFFSDWIFLYYLAKNMEPYLFKNMLVDLAKELKGTHLGDETPPSDPTLYRMLNSNPIDDKLPIESIDDVDCKVKSV